jgi:membrane fusion protein (multidrug efflux system)
MNITGDAHEVLNPGEAAGGGGPPRREALRESPPRTEPEAYTEDEPRKRGADGDSHAPAGSAPPRRLVLRWIAGAILAAILVCAGIRLWNYLGSYESTDDAQIDGHINAIGSRIDGTIVRVYVNDTDIVKAGQPLADIDPRDYEVATEQARANLAEARALVQQAEGNYQAGLAKIAQAEAANAKAQSDAARYRALLSQNVVSRADYDQYISTARVDAQQVKSDRATAAAAGKKIASQQAVVQAAQAALDQALLNISYTHIVAPVGGVVGKKTVEIGQRVQPGQDLLAIVPLDDIWVTANFKETQLRGMRPGQRVTIYVDALGRDFRGRVEGLGGASGEIYSVLPPENATGNYVKVVQRFPVRIRFDPGQDAGHLLRPGMSVEPKVWLG